MCPPLPPASISSGELWAHVDESCVEEETFLLLSFSSFWPYGPIVCKCVYTGHLWGLLDMYINASHHAWEVWGHCFSRPAPCLCLTSLLVSLWCTYWYSCSCPRGSQALLILPMIFSVPHNEEFPAIYLKFIALLFCPFRSAVRTAYWIFPFSQCAFRFPNS